MSKEAKIFGNATTKVAHRRGVRADACYQRALKRGNVTKFASYAEAVEHGYRACGHCRPDVGSRVINDGE